MGAFFNQYSEGLGAFGIRLRLSVGEISGRSLSGKYSCIQDKYLFSVIAFYDFDVGF
ncbi:hypothetical protein SAMN05421820_103190 [Pedobacter steynii]|uniref:Uncharacterized protein n=1 Tax=Pedobacter steynii TaxID=430522 RepID=A0A1G9RB74_9SPHI|nr:hypothetical protein SAMN05421820_103190 [Pedobacter steynii]